MAGQSRKVTINDVAKAANVSIATVSRILNDRDGRIKISDQTRQSVLTKAAEMGYRLNPVASALRSKHSGLIGGVVRDIGDPFLAKLVKTVYRTVHERGQELFIGHSDYQEEVAEKQIRMMMNHLFDGVFIFVDTAPIFLEQLKADETPYTGITGDYLSIDKPRVHTDDIAGIAMALEHLTEYGHTKIGFLGNMRLGVRHRLGIYQDWMSSHSLAIQDPYILPDTQTRKDVSDYFRELRHVSDRPTAFVCATDAIAIDAMNSAHYHGFRVPEDISIVGFDDIDDAADSLPALTTVQQPYEELARQGMDLLAKLIDAPEPSLLEADILLTPKLIIRDSTARL